jgi:predicted nucleotidyltransferase
MTSALAPNQLEAINNACRRHRVARLHAFGSVLRPDYRPGESDIDLLVEFQPDAPEALYKTYFSLLNELRQSQASRIDLVMADAIRNPYVKSSIEASNREIYAA